MRRPSRLPCEAGMEDPRIARTRTAVLDAATDLLVAGGPSAVTVDGIVARSGVAKSTIYRHWDSRATRSCWPSSSAAPRTRPRSPKACRSSTACARSSPGIVDTFRDPQWARLIPALLMLKTHEDGIAALEHRLESRQRDAMRAMFQRGIDEGALRPDLDVEEATAQLIGPLLFAHLTGSVELDHAFGDRTVDAFFAAYGAA